jgi:hypothetical protein
MKSILISCGTNYKQSSAPERESRHIACEVLQQCKSDRAIHANLPRVLRFFAELEKSMSAAAFAAAR